MPTSDLNGTLPLSAAARLADTGLRRAMERTCVGFIDRSTKTCQWGVSKNVGFMRPDWAEFCSPSRSAAQKRILTFDDTAGRYPRNVWVDGSRASVVCCLGQISSTLAGWTVIASPHPERPGCPCGCGHWSRRRLKRSRSRWMFFASRCCGR